MKVFPKEATEQRAGQQLHSAMSNACRLGLAFWGQHSYWGVVGNKGIHYNGLLHGVL